MRLQISLILPFFIAWSHFVVAGGGRSSEMCTSACQMALGPIQWNDTEPSASKMTRSCQSRMGLSSLYLCLRVYCSGDNRATGLGNLNETCQTYLNSPLPPFDIIANYTDDDVSRLRKIQPHEPNPGTVLTEVVIPSQMLFGLSYDTLVCSRLGPDNHSPANADSRMPLNMSLDTTGAMGTFLDS
jgi:hypothetical protein